MGSGKSISEVGVKPDIIIDATSAIHHKYNYEIAKENGIVIIDMTPANLGIACCPAINLDKCLKKDNINIDYE